MKAWRQLPFLVALTLVGTGFRDQQDVSLEGSWSFASSQTTASGGSVAELLPALEDMLGQILRAQEIPAALGSGPALLPETMSIIPTPAPSPLAEKGDRLGTTPAALPVLSQEDFDARFGTTATPLTDTAFNDRFGDTQPPPAVVPTPVARPPVDAPPEGQSAEEALSTATALVAPEAEETTDLPITEQAPPAVLLPDTISVLPTPRPAEASVALPSGAGCASCSGARPTNLAFMQCRERNSYLEQEMSRVRDSGSLVGELIRKGPQRDTLIQPQCMRSALMHKLGENSQLFRTCSTSGNSLGNRAYRPCVSENYFSMVSNSFDLVMRCLAPQLGPTQADQKRDIRQIFGMFTVESGMHLNAVSGTGAAGFGQLTQSAIESINSQELSSLRRSLENAGGLCARLGREALGGNPPMKANRANSCERISISHGNPLKNLIYSVANVLQNKRLLQNDVFGEGRLARKFDLTAADRRRLQTALAVWAHNSGIGGLKTPLAALLNSKYKNRKVTDVNRFIEEMKTAMRDYPHRANSSSARRRETSRYYGSVVSQIQKTEQGVGGGSCLNSSL